MSPFGGADALASKIGRGFDATFFVDVKRAETEQARADHRQADDIGIGPADLRHEFGKGEFGDVPLPIEGEAGENFMMAECRPDWLDSLGRDSAGAEIAEMIVVGRRYRQR